MKTFHPILPSTLLVAVAWSGSSYAATLRVCASGANQSYKTIGSAVAAAAAGDEIDICPAMRNSWSLRSRSRSAALTRTELSAF